jgi:hypothetical protein
MDESTLKPLRYPAVCGSCGESLPRGTKAHWDKEARKATCAPCLGFFDRGTAGGSAARVGARRRQNHEDRVRKAHPRIGGLILALSDEPQSVRSWEVGSVGEMQLGARLDEFRDRGFGVLHDRRIPGSKANIDHLVVGPAGVFVIDAKRYTGKVERRDRGWIFERDWGLYVHGRDQTKLVAGMAKQVDAVKAALDPETSAVFVVLCFIDSEWGLFPQPLRFDAVHVMWPKALYDFLASDGPLDRADVERLERVLAMKLPVAK